MEPMENEKKTVQQRNSKIGGTGCPKYGWNWGRQEYSNSGDNFNIIPGVNDLESQASELVKEYTDVDW